MTIFSRKPIIVENCKLKIAWKTKNCRNLWSKTKFCWKLEYGNSI